MIHHLHSSGKLCKEQRGHVPEGVSQISGLSLQKCSVPSPISYWRCHHSCYHCRVLKSPKGWGSDLNPGQDFCSLSTSPKGTPTTDHVWPWELLLPLGSGFGRVCRAGFWATQFFPHLLGPGVELACIPKVQVCPEHCKNSETEQHHSYHPQRLHGRGAQEVNFALL